MLSESHPRYLQIVRVESLRARAKTDYAAFMLAVVAVVAVPAQVLCGMSCAYLYAQAGQLFERL